MGEKVSLYERVHAMFKRRKPLKHIAIALCILLPTLLAAFSFFMLSDRYGFSYDNLYDITLYDKNGEVIESEKGYVNRSDEESLISLFASITENLKKGSSLPAFLDTSNCLVAYIDHQGTKNEYKFYFSFDDGLGYCTLNGARTYLLDDKDTERILSSGYAESFYSSATPPKLYCVSGEVILPNQVSWNYRSLSGRFYETRNSEITAEDRSYILSGGLYFEFTDAPDICNVVIKQNGSKVFEGSHLELVNAVIDKEQKINIEVEASWLDTADAEFYGDIKYSFSATIHEKADFSIPTQRYQVGSLCVVKCTNIDDVSRISLNCEPFVLGSITFGKMGNDAIALIPITEDMAERRYKITVSYGTAVESFIIYISGDTEEGNIVPSKVTIGALIDSLKELNVSNVQKIKNRVAEKSSTPEKLFTGEFLDFASLGATLYAKRGDSYKVSSSYYAAEGNEYRFGTSGVGVVALNNGRVIETGYDNIYGNYVIVSHGCGLATWYTHLDVVDVSEDQFIIKGETLGKTGSTGLCDGENVLILASLGATFIDPNYLIENSID